MTVIVVESNQSRRPPRPSTELQQAEDQDEEDEAEPVEALAALDPRAGHEEEGAQEGEGRHRQVHVEDAGPAHEVDDEPGPGQRDDRGRHDAQAPDGESPAVLLPTVGIEDDDLAHGLDGRARRTHQEAP